MGLTEPESMDECLYFTRRTEGDKGHIMAWVIKEKCPECGKGVMAKPKNEKTGRARIRAEEYTCSECGHTEPKMEYEPTLKVQIKYTCPKCGKSGEATTPYKRKSFQGVQAYVFQCEHCGEKIGITKKLKAIKKK